MTTCGLVGHHGEMRCCLVVLDPPSVHKRQLASADQVFDLQYSESIHVRQIRHESLNICVRIVRDVWLLENTRVCTACTKHLQWRRHRQLNWTFEQHEAIQ